MRYTLKRQVLQHVEVPDVPHIAHAAFNLFLAVNPLFLLIQRKVRVVRVVEAAGRHELLEFTLQGQDFLVVDVTHIGVQRDQHALRDFEHIGYLVHLSDPSRVHDNYYKYVDLYLSDTHEALDGHLLLVGLD